MRFIIVAFIIIASAAGGYVVRALSAETKEYNYQIPFPDRGTTSSFNLGCRTVAQGSVYESRLDRTANASAGQGTEKLALTIAADGKTASVLYAYDVGNGVADPIPLTVLSKTSSYMVARGDQLLGVTSVILDMKTMKAVVTYTGQGILGIKGSSLLLQCS